FSSPHPARARQRRLLALPRARPGANKRGLMLTRRAPKYFPTFQNLRDHRRIAHITRQTLAPIDIDLTAVVIFAGITPHGLRGVLWRHRISPARPPAVGH